MASIIGQTLIGLVAALAVIFVPWWIGMAVTWDDDSLVTNWLIGVVAILVVVFAGVCFYAIGHLIMTGNV